MNVISTPIQLRRVPIAARVAQLSSVRPPDTGDAKAAARGPSTRSRGWDRPKPGPAATHRRANDRPISTCRDGNAPQALQRPGADDPGVVEHRREDQQDRLNEEAWLASRYVKEHPLPHHHRAPYSSAWT